MQAHLTTQGGVSGVASIRASTASAPILHPRILRGEERGERREERGEEREWAPVEGGGGAAPLHVAEHGHPGVLLQLLHHHLHTQEHDPTFMFIRLILKGDFEKRNKILTSTIPRSGFQG